MLTGIAYGFINLIIDPVVLHPVQMLLDFPIAFGFLGLAGVFSNSKYGIVKGYLLGIVGRYVAHFITGSIFFYMYTPEGLHPVVYSAVYNAMYIVPEGIVTVAILFTPVVYKALGEVKRMAREV